MHEKEKWIMKMCMVFALTITAAPAVADCINLFDGCADEKPVTSSDTFVVEGREAQLGGRGGSNLAVVQSAASSCAQRGYPEFLVLQVQNSSDYSGSDVYVRVDEFGNVYGNRLGLRPTTTTDAIIKCVKQGGVPVQLFLQPD